MKALALAALLVATPACGPWLYAASTPPPGTLASLDTEHERATLTEGAVLAFRCDKAGPCKAATATSDDAAIVSVLPAALARLEPAVWAGMQPSTVFVLVAHAPGKTRIRVRSGSGDVDLAVTVVPAP